MSVAYDLLWRLLHVLLSVQRALFVWVRGRRLWLSRWRRRAAWATPAAALRALLAPAAGTGAFAFHQPAAAGRKVPGGRWRKDGKSLEKLPGHVGLLVTEEETSYADMASLVVWCMAVGISYVSVYDHGGELDQLRVSSALPPRCNNLYTSSSSFSRPVSFPSTRPYSVFGLLGTGRCFDFRLF